MNDASLLRNGDFVRFWSAQTISIFGSLITRAALPFLAILVLNATAGEVAVLRAADLVPGFVIALAAGVWVDRLRRRPVMIVADVGRALLLASIPIAAAAGRLTLLQLYVVAALASGLTVFFDVAEQSLIPTLVTRAQLVVANSRLASTQSVAEVAAFGIAGWLVQLFTAPAAIAVDAVTFLFSAILLGTIRIGEERPAAAPGERHLLREMREGLTVLLKNRSLLAIAGSVASFEFAYGVIGTIIALYGLRELGFTPGPLGLVYAVGGVASLLASVLAPRISGAIGARRSLIAGLLLAGVGTLFLPLARGAGAVSLALLVLQQIVGDGGATIYDINEASLRQSITPEPLLGRINSGVRISALGATLLGTLVGGVLGQAAGYRPTLVVGALATFAGAAIIFASPIGGRAA